GPTPLNELHVRQIALRAELNLTAEEADLIVELSDGHAGTIVQMISKVAGKRPAGATRTRPATRAPQLGRGAAFRRAASRTEPPARGRPGPRWACECLRPVRP